MEQFPQFDVVSDLSDNGFADSKPDLLPTATKAVMKEWKLLQNNLPETVYIRVYSDRVDLLRAVIIGPPKTPYHDGLFFFDFKFPKNYPNKPPKAHYRSFGLRLNPNLYATGKVCLSLLNTWPGPSDTRWRPKVSTMLQVLVSIQGLVLREWPYYNEPGTGLIRTPGPPIQYNNMVFLLSCKTMLYLLNRPPKNFETFVTQHFRARSRAVLASCQAYRYGFARVAGFEYRADIASSFDSDQMKNRRRLCVDEKFASDLEKQYEMLLKAFAKLDPPLIEFSEELHRTVENAKKVVPPQIPPKPSKVNSLFRKIFGCIMK